MNVKEITETRERLAALPDHDVEYSGRAFPVLSAIMYLKPIEISGRFHVERMLADQLGEYGSILCGDDGRRWAIYNLDALVWL